MTLTRSAKPIGTKSDGSPRWHYTFDPETPEHGVIETGPVSGTVQLSDGTVYDVTPDLIEHAPGHGTAIAYHVAKVHERSGRLSKLLFGDDYDGRAAAVIGDESGFTIEVPTD